MSVWYKLGLFTMVVLGSLFPAWVIGWIVDSHASPGDWSNHAFGISIFVLAFTYGVSTVAVKVVSGDSR